MVISCGLLSAALSCGPDDVGVPEIDACEAETHGSEGCSFSLTDLLHLHRGTEDPNAVIVTNPSTTKTTHVQIVRGDYGATPIELEPGGVHVFEINSPTSLGTGTVLRRLSAIRILAEDPVAAYTLAPMNNRASNDGSVLIPDTALGDTYVVASYEPFTDPNHPYEDGQPSFFTVVAVEDGTVVRFTPPVDTLGTTGVPAVEAGAEGQIELDDGDALRIAAAADGDLSGTVVEASAPIWVAGGVRCAFVPDGTSGWCDHMQEVMRPTAHWVNDYPAVPSPARSFEPHIWRVFAGAPGVTVTTDPPLPGAPVVLDELGDWHEFTVAHGEAVWFHADGPISPMQYLAGRNMSGQRGDPSMIQAVAPQSWMQRYVVSTGLRYSQHYLQIVRLEGSETEIFVDGERVEDYRVSAGLEIADHLVAEGSHVVESAEAFGLSSYGYSNGIDGTKWTSYAMPGGFAAGE